MANQNESLKIVEGEGKVTSLSVFRKSQSKGSGKVKKIQDFCQLMERNRSNQERLRSERNKANLSVIRTLKLKK